MLYLVLALVVLLHIESSDLGINTPSQYVVGYSSKIIVSATAYFREIATGKIKSITGQGIVKIDSIEPQLTCEVVGGLEVKCSASDDESGIDSLTGSTDGKTSPIVDNDNYKQYSFSSTKSGTYTFTAIDKAGNKKSVNVKIEDYACYVEAICGEDYGVGSCNSCPNAGCANSNHSSYYEYSCVSEDGKKTIFYLEEAKVATYADGKTFSEDLGYQYEEPESQLSKTIDNVKYTCKLKKNSMLCGKANSSGTRLDIIGQFNKNCRVCGCTGWGVRYNNSNYRMRNDLSLIAESSSGGINAYKIQLFSQSNCSGNKIGTPIFNVGTGGSLSAVKSLLGEN